ncbi:MAG: hypothetical protein ACRYGP_16860 [Janthinobacterium lividum]
MSAVESGPDRTPEKGDYRASAPSTDRAFTPLVLTPESRTLWEAYAVAQQQAEDSLLSGDGLVAAQAFYAFVESFMPQVYGAGVVPLNLRRRQL